ncbi:MAG: hypothetical protein QM756_44190 [Polyangiaceae bacterium]
MLRRIVCFSLAFALLPNLASAWSQRAEFGVRTHGHSFNKAVIESSDCTLHYKLYFAAPAEAYEKPGKAHFQFRARIRFGSGKAVVSKVFGNHGGGARIYEYDYDTGAEGCWAKDEQKLLGVDVEACRGRGCTPAEFP